MQRLVQFVKGRNVNHLVARILLFALTLAARPAFSQAIEATFSGQWAETVWNFEFHPDGTFKRTSQGHFGDPVYEGTYERRGDTIEMLTGHQETWGTINRYYLLLEEKTLVDLHTLDDYVRGNDQWNHLSKPRYDLLPPFDYDTAVWVSRAEFEALAQQSYDWLLAGSFGKMDVNQHVQTLRVINTFLMRPKEIGQMAIASTFNAMKGNSAYENYLRSNFENIPSRGMGWYFPRLQVELLGTPHLGSLYSFR